MTLQYSLDRVTFESLLLEARRRIIPRNREWTMHGPVDPGITLLELFAALLEQRSFLADQLSEPLGRALLALLGDEIKTAQVARTVLAFTASQPAIVPRSVYMRPDRAQLDRTFRTAARVAIAPYVGFELRTFEGTRAELRNGVTLLPAHGQAARSTLVLRFSTALPVGEWTGILLELDSAVAPEWSPRAATVAPPAPVRFGWSDGNTVQPFATGELRDGTLGLRRSGIIQLRVPPGWARAVAAHYEHALVIETSAATFTSPPRVTNIAANSVRADNRHWRTYVAPANTLAPLSDQLLELPVDEGYPLEDRARVRFTEKDQRRYTWRSTHDLATRGPDARMFVVDRARGVLRFGDGLHGRAPYPAKGAQPWVLFEVGGGTIGNIGGYVTWTGSSGGTTWSARNPVPAIGGGDPERLDEARVRVAAERTSPKRAVTKRDHEWIAEHTPGIAIARAHAAIGSAPTCPEIHSPGVTTVYVVPSVPRRAEDLENGTPTVAPHTDPGALDAVRRNLDAARLVAHVIYVASARYRPVRLAVSVEADPHDPAQLRDTVSRALRAYLDPLVGGQSHTGWGFGAPLMPSDLLRVAQLAVDEMGDGAIVAEVAMALDDDELDACNNVDIRDHELVDIRELRVLIKPPRREA